MRGFISYEGLPVKSGGGHKISNKTASEVYESVSQFGNLLTDNPEPDIATISLIVSKPGNNSALGIIWALSMELGLPGIGYSYYLPEWNFTLGWKISGKKIDNAISLLERFPALILSIIWRFHFIEPVRQVALPGQAAIPVLDQRLHNSQIHLLVNQRMSLSMWFTFPFNELSEAATAYIKLVRENLPVKLSDHHWKLWTLSKNKKWIGRKINIELEKR